MRYLLPRITDKLIMIGTSLGTHYRQTHDNTKRIGDKYIN